MSLSPLIIKSSLLLIDTLCLLIVELDALVEEATLVEGVEETLFEALLGDNVFDVELLVGTLIELESGKLDAEFVDDIESFLLHPTTNNDKKDNVNNNLLDFMLIFPFC